MLTILVALALTSGDHVNPVVGDASAALGYVERGADEQARVRGHLQFAHDLLAAADVSALSPQLRAARARNLERLARYARTGVFPHNDDVPGRRPTFVDRRGVICAVGALFAADRGRSAAERIARTHRYSYIAQIDDAELATWQASSGLTMLELAIIQPTYPWPSYRPWADRDWVPFALLDRMLADAPRVVATSEVAATSDFGAASFVAHAQGRLPISSLSFYATLPVAIAFDDDAFAARTGRMPEPGAHLGNAELGAFDGTTLRKIAWLGRVGVVLPTIRAPDTSARFASARAGDAALWYPTSIGIRGAVSGLAAKFRPISDKDSARERISVRLDLGLDVLWEPDDSPFAIPRTGLGLALTYRPVSVLLESVIAYAPGRDGAHHARWGSGISLRCSDETGGRCYRYQPALTVATVRSLDDGWLATVSLELAIAGDPAMEENTNPHLDGW